MNIKIEKYKFMTVMSLINKYFWRTKVGPIFSFATPLVFMLIYFSLGQSNGESDLSFFINGLPTFLSMTIIPLSIVTLPAMNIEFKNSIILRKIKTSGINAFQYNLICFIYFFIASLGFSLFVIILFLIFVAKEIDLINFFNAESLIYGILMLSLISISFGMFLSTFIKTPLTSQLLGFGIFILTLSLSGQFIPIQVIGGVDAVRYISLFSPLNYSSNIFNISCIQAANGYSNSLFDFSSTFVINGFGAPGQNEVFIYDIWQKVLFTIMPIILSISFIAISTKFLRWSGR